MQPFRAILLTAVLTLCSTGISAQTTGNKDIWVPQIDSPIGRTYFRIDQPPHAQPDPSWITRTGARKGVTGRSLEAELFAGPDAAVLRNGFFHAWIGLLADVREAAVLVEPDRIAGLARTKPYLVVPSGALHDLARSFFFKAGLADYARSGGVILCFAQQNGADFTALPVPEGQTLEAAGWEQDGGPLFRASFVQSSHPMLAGIKTMPDVETSGRLIAYPKNSQVILSRVDGAPVLIAYPVGKGWVVVTTLFPDVSYEYEYLEPEEKTLVRDLVLWAKAATRTLSASAGDRINLPVTLRGPATSAKLLVIGPEGAQVGPELPVPVDLRTAETSSALVPYTVPATIQPGIYHLEAVLFDAMGNKLSGPVECDGGRFSVGGPAVAARQQPTPPDNAVAPPEINARAERDGTIVRLKLEIDRGPNAPDGDHVFFARAVGQEKSFTLGAEKQSLSFEISKPAAAGRIAFAIYTAHGRSVARGVVPIATTNGGEVLPERPSNAAGLPAPLNVSGLGKGELSLLMHGHGEKQMVAGTSASVVVPETLPSGVYKLRWKFRALGGANASGETAINVSGIRVRAVNAAVDAKDGRDNYVARFRVHSTAKLSARMKCSLRRPDGAILPVAESEASLVEGEQEVPVAFSLRPEVSGAWELRYALSIRPSQVPGFPAEGIDLASGRTLFDVGDAALLALAATRPVYYDPSGSVELSASVFGHGNAKIELFLDDKRIKKDTLALDGPAVYDVSVTPAPGPHLARAVVSGSKFESAGEYAFAYGMQFSDLSVGLKTAESVTAALPVIMSVRNEGKSAAGPSRVALYESDPTQGGSMIAKAEVPALDPGAARDAVVLWPLRGKAGARTLFAVADADNAIDKTNKRNNTASLAVTVPDLLVTVSSAKKNFAADERVSFSAFASNLTATAYKNISMRITVSKGAGKPVFSDTAAMPELSPGSDRTFERSLDPAPLPPGGYLLQAQVVRPSGPIVSSATFSVLPTLLIKGGLVGTAPAAFQCRPFSFRYSAANAGNIPPSTGALNLEIKAADTGQPVFARQLPLTLESGSVVIDKLDFPRGAYTVTLKANAVNQEYGVSREFLLAQQQLTISSPLEVKKAASVLRVLVWRGKAADPVERAVSEQIVKVAFDDEEGIFYRTADTAEDFTTQAMSGLFNTFVLLEPDELLERFDWLLDRIIRGDGIVIVGSGDRARTAGESFGFRFTEASAGGMLVIPEGSGLGLAGTMPVSGPLLFPQKKGAKQMALIAEQSKSAALLDKAGNGLMFVMSFSLVRSARDTGAASLYGPLLRAAVRSVGPEGNNRSANRGEELQITAPAGKVKARVVVTLPAGAKIIWASREGTASQTAVTYDLTADQEPQKLQYLYTMPEEGKNQASTELFYECGETFVGSGKVE